jgi:hypothetical protein
MWYPGPESNRQVLSDEEVFESLITTKATSIFTSMKNQHATKQ